MTTYLPFAPISAVVRPWILWAVLTLFAIGLAPAQALAMDWIPILRTDSLAPGAPGRTINGIDTGRSPSSAPPLIDENGRLIFLAWIDGAPAGEHTGRLYQWTAEEGLSLHPPAPLSMLEAGCEFGVNGFAVAQNGAYALHARSVGEHFVCESGALLIPDGSEGWSELLPTPEPAISSTWRIGGAGPLGINQHSEVLVETSERYVCPPDSICAATPRDVLYFADPSGATLIYRETSPAPGVAGDARLGPLVYKYGIAGPNDLGQVVVAVPVYVDGKSIQVLYRWDPDSGLELIALQGDAVPGIPNAVFEFLGAPVLDNTGAITFWGRLENGAEVGPCNDDALFTRSPAGITELRFRETATSGSIVLPPLVNEVGGLALVTDGRRPDRMSVCGDFTRRLWGPDGDGNLAVRARQGDPLPDSTRTLLTFDALHLDDAGRLLFWRNSWNTYYMVDEQGALSVLLNGIEPIQLAPDVSAIPTWAHLAFDRNLEHFALGVWTQDHATGEKASTMLIPVPEPSAMQSGLAALAVLGLLAVRSAGAVRS
ncbi:MAG TPA: hypothetical protein EYQ54_19610 [Myxococcales bacterium]|nr:hypothetical protein [Myxococcales bacterium]